MKLFFIFILNLVHQYGCKIAISEIEAAEYACYKEVNLKPQDVPTLANFDKVNEDTENYRKIFGCIFTKMGIIDAQEKIISEGVDNLAETLSKTASDPVKQIIIESFQPCKNITGENAGDTGLQFKNCIRTAALKFRENLLSRNSI
mgnify:CR=1 FL=1